MALSGKKVELTAQIVGYLHAGLCVYTNSGADQCRNAEQEHAWVWAWYVIIDVDPFAGRQTMGELKDANRTPASERASRQLRRMRR